MELPSLRIASPDELDVLLPFVRAYHAFEGVSMSDEIRRKAIAPLLVDGQQGRIFLIEVKRSPVGYVALCFGYSIEFAGRDAFIDELYVEESYRGRGIGRTALESVCKEAAKLGIRAVHLEVARKNERARSLYRSMGFDSREKFHLMSRRLDGNS